MRRVDTRRGHGRGTTSRRDAQGPRQPRVPLLVAVRTQHSGRRIQQQPREPHVANGEPHILGRVPAPHAVDDEQAGGDRRAATRRSRGATAAAVATLPNASTTSRSSRAASSRGRCRSPACRTAVVQARARRARTGTTCSTGERCSSAVAPRCQRLTISTWTGESLHATLSSQWHCTSTCNTAVAQDHARRARTGTTLIAGERCSNVAAPRRQRLTISTWTGESLHATLNSQCRCTSTCSTAVGQYHARQARGGIARAAGECCCTAAASRRHSCSSDSGWFGRRT